VGKAKGVGSLFFYSTSFKSVCTSIAAYILAPALVLVPILAAKIKALGFADYTSQQDFVTRKIYSVSNVTFHTESKYAINIFSSPTVFVQWPFKLLIFRNFWYFHQ